MHSTELQIFAGESKSLILSGVHVQSGDTAVWVPASQGCESAAQRLDSSRQQEGLILGGTLQQQNQGRRMQQGVLLASTNDRPSPPPSPSLPPPPESRHLNEVATNSGPCVLDLTTNCFCTPNFGWTRVSHIGKGGCATQPARPMATTASTRRATLHSHSPFCCTSISLTSIGMMS